jgi:hypothetical protein
MELQAWNFPAVVRIYLALAVQLSCVTSFVGMITLVITYNKDEQRAAIKFLWAEGVEIQHRLLSAFCCCESYPGTDMLTSGQTSVTGEEQSGHLSASQMNEH